MSPFIWGLLAGLALAAGLGALLARALFRRVLRLQRRAKQAERLAELGTLTGGLAHEIKNPLSTVQLNLQLLQEDLASQSLGHPRLVNRLDVAQRETSRLRDILDDFLRYAGRMELDRRPTDLGQLLEELADFFAPQAQLSRVRLRLKPTDDKVMARVDARLIKQAVLNLMLNATQAMDAHGGGDLILSVTRDPDCAVIDVVDTGPGIAPDVAERIFDAYFTMRKGGTGLGLATTRRIAEEHGGSVTVRSEPGKGSNFALRLPVADALAA
jgi:signal transduction histidine kinase